MALPRTGGGSSSVAALLVWTATMSAVANDGSVPTAQAAAENFCRVVGEPLETCSKNLIEIGRASTAPGEERELNARFAANMDTLCRLRPKTPAIQSACADELLVHIPEPTKSDVRETYDIMLRLRTEKAAREAAEKAEYDAEQKKRLATERACKAQGFTKGLVRIGMTSAQVIRCGWGQPEDINRTTSRHGTREQWVYGGGNYLYFENGRLETIQN